MAHKAQMEFVQRVKRENPKHFRNRRVLEIGSLYVNGTVRPFFEDCDYVGIDCHPGRCVDVVTLAHAYTTDKPFDTVISCEAFEHDPHLRQTIDVVNRLLKPGGLFVATWAGPGRPVHGTKSSDGQHWGPDGEYYRGVSGQEMLYLIGNDFFPRKVFARLDKNNSEEDVYFWGVKKCPLE